VTEAEIITAHHLKVRKGQHGFVVIETIKHNPRVSFLFTADEAIDFAERMTLYAHGAEPRSRRGREATSRL
jgi:hypothetical protein